MSTAVASLETESGRPARWWHKLPDGRIQCDLCPRDCRLHEGQRGLCFVRQRVGDAMMLATYGRSSGFCIDPIEKKPLNHFHPGSSVFSFGTAGCNLACKFCQNWDISKSREMDRLMDAASPERIAQAAQETACASVAFTYNDPVIFAEYAMDAADACHARGVQTVAVTAGYMHAAPRREFYAKMDAANVDLKGFSEAFYFQQTGAHLAPVLDTLQMLMAASAIANDGKMVTPHILYSMLRDGHQYNVPSQYGGSPITAQTAHTLSEMLAQSLNAESSEALLSGYRVAGKTGTAQIPTEFGYDPSVTNASFIGWGPVDDPQFMIYVWLNAPTSSIWGSQTAAPTFSKVAEQTVILLNIPPDNVRFQLTSK